MSIKLFLKGILEKFIHFQRRDEEKKLQAQVLELQKKTELLMENQRVQSNWVNSKIADFMDCQKNHICLLEEELRYIRETQHAFYSRSEQLAKKMQLDQSKHLHILKEAIHSVQQNQKEHLNILAEEMHSIQQSQSVLFSQTQQLNLLAEDIQSYQRNHLRFFIEDMHNFQQERRDYLSLEYQRYRNDSPKKKVLVCGYYGAQNCGDELMLRACLNMLDTSKVDVTIMLYNNYAFNPNYYKPYKVIHYPKSIGDTDFLAETFDAIIWGGGAVIDDRYYFYNSTLTNLSYILNKTTQKMLSLGKKAFILGVSANHKLENRKYIEELNNIFQSADIISLRDTNSRDGLIAAGVDCSKVRIVDDLALSLEYPQHSRLPAADIGLILMPNRENLEQITQIAKQVVHECNAVLGKNCKVRFISFYNEYDNDLKLYETIAQQAGLDNYEIIDPMFTPEEIGSVIHSCDFIVSMRYHAMLLSVILGKKTLGISLGDVHPHYAYKVNYIQEHYCNALCVADYSNMKPEQIRQALCSEIKPYEQEKLHQIYEDIKQLFEEAVANILGE